MHVELKEDSPLELPLSHPGTPEDFSAMLGLLTPYHSFTLQV